MRSLVPLAGALARQCPFATSQCQEKTLAAPSRRQWHPSLPPSRNHFGKCDLWCHWRALWPASVLLLHHNAKRRHWRLRAAASGTQACRRQGVIRETSGNADLWCHWRALRPASVLLLHRNAKRRHWRLRAAASGTQACRRQGIIREISGNAISGATGGRFGPPVSFCYIAMPGEDTGGSEPPPVAPQAPNKQMNPRRIVNRRMRLVRSKDATKDHCGGTRGPAATDPRRAWGVSPMVLLSWHCFCCGAFTRKKIRSTRQLIRLRRSGSPGLRAAVICDVALDDQDFSGAGVSERWKWTCFHSPWIRCHTRVSSTALVVGVPSPSSFWIRRT